MTRAHTEAAAVEAGYTRGEILTTTRRSPVKVTMIERTCGVCGAVGYDVGVDAIGRARCFSGLRCRASLPIEGAITAQVRALSPSERGRMQRALNRARGSR